MIGLAFLYALCGLLFGGVAVLTARDAAHPRRWGSAAFWGLIALAFAGGDRLGDIGNGLLVLALVGLAGLGLPGKGRPSTTDDATRAASAASLRNRLFLPALIVPAVTLAGTLWLAPPLVAARDVTLVALGLGAIIAIAVVMAWLRPPPLAPLHEGRRLLESVGWALLLPQLLASLGAVFAAADVGAIVGELAAGLIPDGNRLAAVVVFTGGMAGFTMLMGNAFAAFPIMMAAVGLPVLVRSLGGDVAVIAAVGMLSGFCGTLLTPMAANFNLVPARLLDLPRHAVIRAQAPTALALWLFNTVLIWGVAFR